MKLNSADDEADRPLAGVRVLALENYVAGPLATMLLADWGADVVKIEPPAGDTYRTFPPVESSAAGTSSVSFVRLNRGKRSVVLDLSTESGRETFLQLVARADVIVQNLKPGSLLKLGLGYAVLEAANPRVILVSISGFGQPDVMPGPYTTMPAFDLIGQAMSGLAYTTGQNDAPPAPIGFPIIDTTVADWAASATLLALFQRERTGRGQHLDVSMYDVAVHLNEYNMGAFGWTGKVPTRGRLATSAPFELIRASNGFVAVAVSGQTIFERFCSAIDRKELAMDPRFANGTMRSEEMPHTLIPIIEEWSSRRTVDEALARLTKFGVPASKVQTLADVFECPQVEAREMILRVPDDVLGEVATVGNPIKGNLIPSVLVRPAPQLGEHSSEVVEEWLDAPVASSARTDG
ncbi:L-carnitine dehydratase/bile acid-inducible protein F [marine actinobacterium PHSC20C1]|nr:L-carnitine dehydratase/bile acid-inducible protein F [marine actinobacterium PHSC20C1]